MGRLRDFDIVEMNLLFLFIDQEIAHKFGACAFTGAKEWHN